MKPLLKKWRPAIFSACGALAGLIYYYLTGCLSGHCPITSSPLSSMAYMCAVCLLLSVVFDGGQDGNAKHSETHQP